MKKILPASLFFLTSFQLTAQDFPGYRTGNYTGVNGVFFNPANIADSRYRFDINLFSISTSLGNNKANFKIKSLGNSTNADSLQTRLFGANAGPVSGMANVDILGPSFMFNAGKKSSIALTSRIRTMANAIDIDGKLAKQLTDDFNDDAQLPYTLSSNLNMRLALNSWSEYGASFAQIISDDGPHFFKGGVTLKYLSGIANGYLNINKLKGTINSDIISQDGYLSNTTGSITAGFSGTSTSDFGVTNGSNVKSSGLGADIGFVYEYRPDHATYLLDGDNQMRDRNKYKLRAGFALLDLGKIKYKTDPSRSGGYNIDITGNERFYLRQLAETDIDDFDSFFRMQPQYFTAVTDVDGKYKVSLPSTLQLDVDYHLHRGFYTSLAAQIPLTTKAVFSSRHYSGFTLTPRYEGRAFSVYLPVNHNSLTKFNAGLSLRAGPLFVGSGSLLTAALGNSKQIDFHVGLRFGGLQKDVKKTEEKRERRAEKRVNKSKKQVT